MVKYQLIKFVCRQVKKKYKYIYDDLGVKLIRQRFVLQLSSAENVQYKMISVNARKLFP